ncbi:LLM class flavin-dependent oxidoreductase [Nonomuraea endophytica]|uniref:LLM class flavin-dependent oxidoreductase n=1 Tax=Nonomuraea endophytica TaxID=714136 RepID=UPI0037CA5007
MKFGIGIGRTLAAQQAALVAVSADELGYEHCTFIESQNLCRDSTVMMALAAAGTTRIKLGHAVTNPYIRHPAVLANTMATIDELSGGRAFLGIGAGGSAVAMVGHTPRPLGELDDLVSFFRAFVAGEETSWHGAPMKSGWSRRSMPVVLGTHGARSCRLAGRVADGVFLPGLDPWITQWKRARVAEGAAQAGRRPADLELWSRGALFVHDDEDYAREFVRSYAATSAFFLWRSAVSRTEPVNRELAAALPAGVVDEMAKLAERYRWDQHEAKGAEHARDLSPDLIDCFAIYGPPARCAERLAALAEVGVDAVSFTLYGVPDKVGMITRFIQDVAGQLR